MSSIAAQTLLTPQEYIAAERKATLKSEYISGKIVAMSGASIEHNLISVNTVNGLYNQLAARGSLVFASDMRIGINAGDSYFYPDVSVVCEKPRFEDSDFDTQINPIVVVEVLSQSTETYDRGENLSDINNWNHFKNTFSFHKIRFGLNTIFEREACVNPMNLLLSKKSYRSYLLMRNFRCN